MGKVYITDYIKEPDIEREILQGALTTDPGDDVEVLLVWHEQIDDAYLARFPKLKGVVRYGVGYDMLDLDALSRRGIVACNTPDYGTEEVADTTIGMILSLTRGIVRYDSQCRLYSKGSWQENTLPSVRRSSELTLGVIGAGRIGGSVLLRAAALRFRALMYDPYQPRGHEKMLGAERVDSLSDLLAESDIVSCHAPLTNETRGLVDSQFVNSMRDGAVFINTARGAIVSDLDIFNEPLRSEKLFGVGLDVLPHEPPVYGPLLDAWRSREPWLDGRLIINPHAAFYSVEAFSEMRRKAAANAQRIIAGVASHNQLLPGSL